jgi:dihydroxyacetone kinase-like protein
MNAPESVVTEYLRGLAASHPEVIEFNSKARIVQRKLLPTQPKVGLISGGGSGCEPMHSGYVGFGGLDAACPGEIFTSPVPAQIMAATERADSGKGVLYIIKNFGGEVMNFGLSAEIMKRKGIEISKVLVNDDCSFPISQFDRRRGLGATIFVEKIAGAAAQRGDNLSQVTSIAKKVVANSRSYGVAFNSCTTPKLGHPNFEMPENEFDIGVGIGGDRGHSRSKMVTADKIAKILIEQPALELELALGKNIILLLSGLGSTPSIELYTLSGIIQEKLESVGTKTVRSLVGNFITSLDSFGVIATFLVADEELLELYDLPIDTPALRWGK